MQDMNACNLDGCGRGSHTDDVPHITERQLPWMESEWTSRLTVFNQATHLEIVLSGILDSKALLYQWSPFMEGIFKSSFESIAIHSQVEQVLFTHGLEKVGSCTATSSLLISKKEDGWYYYGDSE